MAQPEYFGPLAAPPQVLFSNFCLKFLLLCGLQGWTAATARLHRRVIQLEHLLRGSSSRLGCCREPPRTGVTLGHSRPHSHKGILHTLPGVILSTINHGKVCGWEHADPHVSWECHLVRIQVRLLHPSRARRQGPTYRAKVLSLS